MKFKGAIFDLDGTLLDSMAVWDTIGEDYLYSLGIKPREDLKETFRKMTLSQAACYYKSEYGLPGTVEAIMAGVDQMIRGFYENQVLPKQGAVSFLHRLHAAGIKMCVATATEEDLVKAALGRNGMLDYFSAVFTCTNVGHGKDEPDIFEAARRFLGTEKSETLVLEDALYAARTAKEAGFPVCAVYDPSEPGSDELMRTADYYVRNFAQAERILFP